LKKKQKKWDSESQKPSKGEKADFRKKILERRIRGAGVIRSMAALAWPAPQETFNPEEHSKP